MPGMRDGGQGSFLEEVPVDISQPEWGTPF